MKYITYLLPILILFSACSPKPSPKLKEISYGSYTKSSYENIPTWKDENFDEVFNIFLLTCKRKSNNKIFKEVCLKTDTIGSKKLFFENNFTPYLALSDNSLATGYFEPTLKGSLTKTSKYIYPIYATPSDMLSIELVKEYKKSLSKPLRGRLVDGKVKPYFSRKEINDGALEDKPICYVEDKIELFFLQVQGSGRIELENGDILYLGFSDQNGFPYVSIGKEMIKENLLKKEEVSLQSITTYMKNHPEKVDKILNSNPSYVFFEKRSVGATGSLGVELIAERSVAVDRKNIPLGMPLFISTKDPLSEEKITRTVFAHDTGGAIKGESRVDIFFGSSEIAKKKAGQMQAPLKLWMLVPNDYLKKVE